MRNLTTKQLGESLGVNYIVAAGIMKMLVNQGQAKLAAKVFNITGRGKPTRVYSVPDQIKIKVPKVVPQPKYQLVGSRLLQTTSVRHCHVPKKHRLKKAV